MSGRLEPSAQLASIILRQVKSRGKRKNVIWGRRGVGAVGEPRKSHLVSARAPRHKSEEGQEMWARAPRRLVSARRGARGRVAAGRRGREDPVIHDEVVGASPQLAESRARDLRRLGARGSWVGGARAGAGAKVARLLV
jgi:hypothetical protein